VISLHRFYSDGIQLWSRSDGVLRYGQAMFNHLCDVRPELASLVRGTKMDPFYASTPGDPRWDAFVDFIERRWYAAIPTPPAS
jgi:hypothetical protein